MVTVLLPAAIANAPLPPAQLTVGIPDALKVPLTPPVYAVVHAVLEQALRVSVLDAQVTPVPVPCCIWIKYGELKVTVAVCVITTFGVSDVSVAV